MTLQAEKGSSMFQLGQEDEVSFRHAEFEEKMKFLSENAQILVRNKGQEMINTGDNVCELLAKNMRT